MEHLRKKLDLPGQRFGKLAVLAPPESIGGQHGLAMLAKGHEIHYSFLILLDAKVRG